MSDVNRHVRRYAKCKSLSVCVKCRKSPAQRERVMCFDCARQDSRKSLARYYARTVLSQSLSDSNPPLVDLIG